MCLSNPANFDIDFQGYKVLRKSEVYGTEDPVYKCPYIGCIELYMGEEYTAQDIGKKLSELKTLQYANEIYGHYPAGFHIFNRYYDAALICAELNLRRSFYGCMEWYVIVAVWYDEVVQLGVEVTATGSKWKEVIVANKMRLIEEVTDGAKEMGNNERARRNSDKENGLLPGRKIPETFTGQYKDCWR